MASVQRDENSNVGAFDRAYSSRALLPAEVELCNALGLSVEDYWYFCRLAETHVKERGEAYDLVPDIQNGALPVAIVSLVVGLASSAASYLLAPKPKAPKIPSSQQQKEATRLSTANITGQTKFAALYGFDSVQDLATLGSIIPLVFANRDNANNIGGIRAKAFLLWSQMLSKSSQQEFKGLFTLGMGSIAATPDIEGYALGDQLLKTYSRERFALYYLPSGGRISEKRNRYVTSLLPSQGFDDVFLARDELAPSKFSSLFSGTRTPNSQTVFGCYSPIANGSQYWLNYELVMVFNDVDRVKEEKILRPYIIRQAMERKNNTPLGPGTFAIAANDTLTFQISSANEDENAYPPHGLSDVNNGIADRHTFADDNINVGDIYLFGSAIIECIGTSTDKPYEKGDAKSYIFKCVEPGFGQFQPADGDAAVIGNVPYGQHLMRLAIGMVTNNRKCNQTEIGIRSTVWKRLDNFPNINSQPENAVLAQYAADNIFFSLGTINRYITRYSFFKVQARPVGSSITSNWRDIMSSQVFAVKGNSPQPQYNVLRIVHPFGQYEYRILPVPGSTIVGQYIGNPVHLLTGVGDGIISADDFFVAYSGERIILTADMASNPEFVIGGRKPVDGIVNGLSPTSVGELPLLPEPKFLGSGANWDAISRTLITGVWINQSDAKDIRAYWEGVDVTEKLSVNGEYQIGIPYGINIPAKVEWKRAGSARLSLTSPAYYIEVDAAGNFIGAVWNNANVNLQAQQGAEEVLTALYRRGTQFTTAQGSTSIINDPTTPPQYDPYTEGAYFGVWQVRGQPSSTRRAFWNGVEVPLNVLVEVVPGQIGRYVVGTIQDYFPSINCDVYRITRQIQTTTGSTRYFYSIENGSYEVVEPGFDTYYISKFELTNPDDLPFVYEPADYSLTGGSGVGLSINASSFGEGQWQWLLRNGGAGYKQGEIVTASFPDGTTVPIQVGVTDATGDIVPSQKINPLDAIADYWKYEAEQTSHRDQPEHSIVYVNEQVRQTEAPTYSDLSLVGLRLLAGREWSSLGQLTVYCQKGIDVERLITDAGVPTSSLTGPTNNLPEIAYNLLVSPKLGAGKKISALSVDRNAMQIAAQFCRANGFTWDGVVGDRVNLRDWIFTQAAYCLLDFTIIGGRFALLPSVPYNANTLEIAPSQAPAISALFTDGNIRNLKVTWLTAEERRLFQAVVLYREEVLNGFSSQKTLRVRLTDAQGGAETDPEETFDLTEFCTNPAQALTFAKHALLLRREIDHSITFETVPGAAASLSPGAYIKLISEATHTSRFNNGSIDDQGNITSTTSIGDGTHSILYWRPGQTEVKPEQLVVSGKKTSNAALFGTVFTVTTTTTEKRIYKIETISINSEGFIEVTATHQPIAANGGLATIQFDPIAFKVDD